MFYINDVWKLKIGCYGAIGDTGLTVSRKCVQRET